MSAKFELNYNHEVNYDEKVTVEIKLQTRPTSENYKKMVLAINELSTLANLYIKIPTPVAKEKK